MKQLLLILGLSILLFSCGADEYADPKVVAEKFLANYVTMNYEEAKKYTSADFHAILDLYETDKALMDETVINDTKTATAEIKSMDIKEAEGVAFVKFTNSQLPDLVDELEMKKEGAKWLVKNVERRVDILLDDKFSEDVLDDILEEVADQGDSSAVED